MSSARKHSRRITSWAYHFLPAPQINEYKSIFSYLDTDKDGILTCQELSAAFTLVGIPITEGESRQLIKDTNAGSKGEYITESEFVILMSRKHLNDKPDQLSELISTFKLIDADNDGFVNAIDLQKVLYSVGNNVTIDEIHNLIAASDPDNQYKGFISLDSFLKLM